MNKILHENFARFFEKPTREGLRELLRTNVGETDQCDFKHDWPLLSKMARHILGFANSGGGVIVLGVAQKDDNSLQTTGLNSLLDKAQVEDGIRKFIPNGMRYEVLDFSYEASEYHAIIGKKFQVVLVEDNPTHLPFVCPSDGGNIRMNAIYVRRGTETVEASHDELQQLINRRIETGYSSSRELSLQEHLEQLRILYKQILMYTVSPVLRGIMKLHLSIPVYPEEDYEQFIARMIESKKRLIERNLGIECANAKNE